ncbi:hypothetical protein [Microcoleus vaginatus]|uniref:hypothetical protein n=1 Tax=Microcoleus vaginatus TaxID=119532 RepID=UPI001F6067B7
MKCDGSRTGEGEAFRHKITPWKHELSPLGLRPPSRAIAGDDLLEMSLVLFICYTEPMHISLAYSLSQKDEVQ